MLVTESVTWLCQWVTDYLSLSLPLWVDVCVCVLIKVSGTVNVINATPHTHTVIPMWQMINEESQPHSWED